jgi:hypothetical protein
VNTIGKMFDKEGSKHHLQTTMKADHAFSRQTAPHQHSKTANQMGEFARLTSQKLKTAQSSLILAPQSM